MWPYVERWMPSLPSGNPHDVLMALHRLGGPVVHLGCGQRSVYFLFSSAANEYVLGRHPEGFLWRDGVKSITPITGDRAFGVCDGFEHRRYRSAVEDGFAARRLEAGHHTIRDTVHQVIAGWPEGAVVDVAAGLRAAVRRCVLRVLFDDDVSGLADDVGALLEPGLQYMNSLSNLFQTELPGTRFARVMRSRRAADGLIYEAIGRRRREAAHAGPPHADVLGLLLRPGAGGRLGPFDDEEVRDQVVELFAAGQETTTAALMWLFRLLLLDPDALAQATREATAGPQETTLHSSQWGRLRFIRASVSETLRIFPPVPVAPRRSKHRFVIDGREIPAGAYLILSQYVSHRLASQWPDPLGFRPHRWLKGAQTPTVHRYSYFPFGLGARRCIGASLAKRVMVIAATEILRHVRMTPLFTDLGPTSGVVTLAPRDGVRARVDRNTLAGRAAAGFPAVRTSTNDRV